MIVHCNYILLFVLCTIQYPQYSKTPNYHASWREGIRPGKSRGIVNQITTHTDLPIKFVFRGMELRPSKLRDLVNKGTVNPGFTVKSNRFVCIRIAKWIHLNSVCTCDMNNYILRPFLDFR